MEVYAFKKRLQSIVGQQPDQYRAVDLVGALCKNMADLGLDPVHVAGVLSEAARLVVEHQAPQCFLRYLEMEETINRRVRSIYDDPEVRKEDGIPDP